MPRRIGLRTVSVLIGIWLLAPIFIVIPLSFTAHQSFVFPPTEYSALVQSFPDGPGMGERHL